MMTCKERSAELVELARRETDPNAEMRMHFSACPACAERWRTEQALANELRGMRLVAGASALVSRDARRRALLHEFDRRQPVVLPPPVSIRPARPRLTWMLAAAAAVFCAMFVGHELGVRSRPLAPPATRIRTIPRQQSIVYEASFDASAISDDDFVAVPYAPPLAQGELVRVIRTELYPEALTSMGIDYDPASGSTIPAEVVVGEDGLPRAVRIMEDSPSQY